uniref:Uncharacterized protein n=1 Tax=uncultured marine thaumarchaeote KM3_95_D02 TaxID=1456347 RepID=A0A075I1W5_9ARCH|nr:hypothetical protein [uncultured marine thaumarchaeote KM3_95_D02]
MVTKKEYDSKYEYVPVVRLPSLEYNELKDLEGRLQIKNSTNKIMELLRSDVVLDKHKTEINGQWTKLHILLVIDSKNQN